MTDQKTKRKLPVPDWLKEKLSTMSRARRYKAVRIANGLCGNCGSEPLVSKGLGMSCLRKQRERMRRKKNIKRRRPNSLSYTSGPQK